MDRNRFGWWQSVMAVAALMMMMMHTASDGVFVLSLSLSLGVARFVCERRRRRLMCIV